MDEKILQMGQTRSTHYRIAYHLVWIPKYRRRVLTGEVQKETKRLIAECGEQQGLTLLAMETDEDHIHVLKPRHGEFTNSGSDVDRCASQANG
jgi:REP element-mobilizing transposase RayT